MNTASDAAEQIVRMSLDGAQIALRVTGNGAKKAAPLIYRALRNARNESTRTRGAIRLANLTRSGKRLDVTEVMDKDLKKFCTEAKKYGILYTVLKDRKRTDGLTEIMYKSEDKEKLNRIFEKLDMVTCDSAEVQDGSTPDHLPQKPPDGAGLKVSDPDAFVEELLKKAENVPVIETEQAENPTNARNVTRDRSGPDSRSRTAQGESPSTDSGPAFGERRSVRKELAEIKAELNDERRGRNAGRDGRIPIQIIKHKLQRKNKKYKER